MSDKLDNESTRVYRVLKTCYKMLNKRGYHVDEAKLDDKIYTMDQFRQEQGLYNNSVRIDRSKIVILCALKDDLDDKIYTFFAPVEKINKTHVEDYYKQMVTDNVKRAILIIGMPMTSAAKDSLKKFASKGIRIDIFHDKELLVDITEHKLVPEHRLLTQTEKQELLLRYRLKESQLPRIQAVDPVARYFGLKARDVVRIERPSETAGRYITYRICI